MRRVAFAIIKGTRFAFELTHAGKRQRQSEWRKIEKDEAEMLVSAGVPVVHIAKSFPVYGELVRLVRN